MENERVILNELEQQDFEKYKDLPFFDPVYKKDFITKVEQKGQNSEDYVEKMCDAYFNGYRTEPKYKIKLPIEADMFSKDFNNIFLVEDSNGKIFYSDEVSEEKGQKNIFSQQKIAELNKKVKTKGLDLFNFAELQENLSKTMVQVGAFDKAELNVYEIEMFKVFKNYSFYSYKYYRPCFINKLYKTMQDQQNHQTNMKIDENYVERMVQDYFNGYKLSKKYQEDFVIMMPKNIGVEIHYRTWDDFYEHDLEFCEPSDMFLAKDCDDELVWTNFAEKGYKYIFSQKEIDKFNAETEAINLDALKVKCKNIDFLKLSKLAF